MTPRAIQFLLSSMSAGKRGSRIIGRIVVVAYVIAGVSMVVWSIALVLGDHPGAGIGGVVLIVVGVVTLETVARTTDVNDPRPMDHR